MSARLLDGAIIFAVGFAAGLWVGFKLWRETLRQFPARAALVAALTKAERITGVCIKILNEIARSPQLYYM